MYDQSEFAITHTTVPFIMFTNDTFTHGCRIDRESCFLEEVFQFIPDSMANGTSIDKNDDVISGSENLTFYLIQYEFFYSRVIGRGAEFKRRL